MGNILYISYDGMTDPLGQSQVIPYLKGLSDTGHNITLISCEKAERSGQLLYTRETLKAAGIKWYPLKYQTFPPVASRFLNVHRVYEQAKKLHEKEHFQVVHCRSYMAALAGLKLKRKHGTKFIFDMRGFWADERFDGNIWSKGNPLHNLMYRYFKRKEKQFLKEADIIVSLTHSAEQEILSWKNLKVTSDKITVIPCCVDTAHFSREGIAEQEKEELRQQLKISSGDFVLSYLGSFSTWYLPGEMMRFFKRLLIKYPAAKFLFITPEDKELILQMAKNEGVEEEKITTISAKRNEVPALLSLSDISIFFIKPVYSKKASSPVKMGEVMSMGIPLLCNAGVGDVEEIINNTGAGIMVRKFNDKEYDSIISRLSGLLSRDKIAITAAANKYFSLQDGISSYNNIYKSLLNKS